MTSVAIVVPLYANKPTKDEKASLLQCKKILGKYPIIVICPQTFDTTEYKFLTDKF